VSSKQPGSSSHAGLSGLGSNLAITTDDYISTLSHGYGTDYTALERRHYGEHHAGYMPTDLERRYADPVGHSHQVVEVPCISRDFLVFVILVFKYEHSLYFLLLSVLRPLVQHRSF
jgi:hypothetical protein